jgi:hypothetical protein
MFSRLAIAMTTLISISAFAQQPSYLQDRGSGLPTSMFGTYVQPHELLVYPFLEYTMQNLEYKPSEMGYGVDQDFRGRYRETEALLFLGYGVSDRLALEFEAAMTKASLRKSATDPSGLPSRLSESGLGDTQVQANWRWSFETASRPEIWSYLEADLPLQRNRKLIGTQGLGLKLGTGVIKGFPIGTFMFRMAAQHESGQGTVELGEYALEYLKRISPKWRIYTGIEGSQDEIEYIFEVQRKLGAHSFIKINNAFGITSKAPRWAPEIGIAFSF